MKDPGYSIVTLADLSERRYEGATVDQFYPHVLTVTDVATDKVLATFKRHEWKQGVRYDEHDDVEFAFQAGSRRVDRGVFGRGLFGNR